MSKAKKDLDEITTELAPLIRDLMIGQASMKDLYKISDDEMEAIYTAAYSFYQHGNFKKAKELFKTLIHLNYKEKKYFMGLAASRQMLKEYTKAAETYGFAALMDAKDPTPAFYAAECFRKDNNNEKAILALEAVMEITKDGKAHKEIRDHAEKLLAGLKKLKKK